MKNTIAKMIKEQKDRELKDTIKNQIEMLLKKGIPVIKALKFVMDELIGSLKEVYEEQSDLVQGVQQVDKITEIFIKATEEICEEKGLDYKKIQCELMRDAEEELIKTMEDKLGKGCTEVEELLKLLKTFANEEEEEEKDFVTGLLEALGIYAEDFRKFEKEEMAKEEQEDAKLRASMIKDLQNGVDVKDVAIKCLMECDGVTISSI